MAVATGDAENKTIQIIYDPELPTRVWFKGQGPDRVSGISVNFMVIHIAQTIFVLWLCFGLVFDDLRVDSGNTIYLLIPIIIEAAGLVIIGFFSWPP